MLSYLQALSIRLGLPLESLLAIGVGLGVLLLLWAVLTAVRRPDPAVQRIAAIAGARRLDRMDRALLLPSAKGPSGLMKAFVPTREEKLGALQRKLIQAGVTRPNAVGLYTAVRIALALGLPLAFLGLTALALRRKEEKYERMSAWSFVLSFVLLALAYVCGFPLEKAIAAPEPVIKLATRHHEMAKFVLTGMTLTAAASLTVLYKFRNQRFNLGFVKPELAVESTALLLGSGFDPF